MCYSVAIQEKQCIHCPIIIVMCLLISGPEAQSWVIGNTFVSNVYASLMLG